MIYEIDRIIGSFYDGEHTIGNAIKMLELTKKELKKYKKRLGKNCRFDSFEVVAKKLNPFPFGAEETYHWKMIFEEEKCNTQ